MKFLINLYYKNKNVNYYILAFLLGLSYALYFLPNSFLLGDGRLFEQGDVSQSLSGWLFYRADTWHFPLLETNRLNVPEGISIAFTDSIPLFAIIFKLIRTWLPVHFQYFGIWYILIFILQAIAGVFLIRSLNCRQWYAALAGCCFALLSPVLAFRLGHTALMTHGLIIIGLGVYFRGISKIWPSDRSFIWLTLLTFIGLLVHPYLLALIFSILIAFLIDDARVDSGWKIQAKRLFLVIAGLIGIMLIFGYGKSSIGAGGFGFYSMNLLAPICGGRLTSCYVDMTGGQYEGFNYLGAGILILIIIEISKWFFFKNSNFKLKIIRHLGLILILLGMTLYALSNIIYAGHILILNLPLPELLAKITSVFRANGRFFWVVNYSISFAVLASLFHTTTRKQALSVLIFILPLQWWDTQPYWENLKTTMKQPALHDLDAWRMIVTDVKQINVYPAFSCQEGEFAQYLLFHRLAAYFEIKLDTGYFARAAPNCAAKKQKFEQSFQPNNLYVLAAPYFHRSIDNLPQGFQFAFNSGQCAQWRRTLLCKTNMNSTLKSLSQVSSVIHLQPVGSFTEKTTMIWEAQDFVTNFVTNNGKVINGELRPRESAKKDVLSFGPYMILPAGHFRAQLEYRSALPVWQNAGAWDAVAAPISGGQGKTYQAGNLLGTADEIKTITIEIIIKPEDGPLEIRTIYPGSGDLAIRRLLIES